MKVISTIIVILLVQCVHLQLCLSFSVELPPLKYIPKPTAIIDKMNRSCFLGAKSMTVNLYDRNNPEGKVLNKSSDNISRTNRVFFLCHGFISSSAASYDLALVLQKIGYTVFSLDWSDAACTNGIPVVNLAGYPSAVSNTRDIGIFMADYVKWLHDKFAIPLKQITFIGHSLGAHVCGFAAKQIQKWGIGNIPLIIGADAAAPMFSSNNCTERLCKKDADVVICLHTSPLGIQFPLFDIDIIFGNGRTQPGCLIPDVPCSHSKSMEYVRNWFEGCEMVAVPSDDTNKCIIMNDKMITGNMPKKEYKIKHPKCIEKNSSNCTAT